MYPFLTYTLYKEYNATIKFIAEMNSIAPYIQYLEYKWTVWPLIWINNAMLIS